MLPWPSIFSLTAIPFFVRDDGNYAGQLGLDSSQAQRCPALSLQFFRYRIKHARAQTTLQEKSGLELKDFAAHGGGFPILLERTGCIGTITVSGLPQREDHALVIGVLQEYLGLAGEDLALDAPAAS